jgi:hypothetical protein
MYCVIYKKKYYIYTQLEIGDTCACDLDCEKVVLGTLSEEETWFLHDETISMIFISFFINWLEVVTSTF